jgi:hypothetical protein
VNRSAAVLGIGVLAVAVVVGVIVYLQLPSPDTPTAEQAAAPANPVVPRAGGSAATATRPSVSVPAASGPRMPAPPGFDVVRVDRDGNVVIAGKADPDCAVTVADGDTPIGTATADHRGDWVIVPGEPLEAGESQLSLSAKCGDRPPVQADRLVVLIVPERAPRDVAAVETATGTPGPAAGVGKTPTQRPKGMPPAQDPAAASATDASTRERTARPAASAGATGADGIASAGPSASGQASRDRGAIVVAIPRDTSQPAEVMQAPSEPASGVAVGSIDYDDAGQVVVSGTAAPDSTVQVYLDNRIIGQAQTAPDGRWQVRPDTLVEAGKYDLRADQVRPDGAVVARTQIAFVRGKPLTDLPDGRIVVIQPGDYLWKIARARYGTGARYTLIFDANRAQISDPDLIFPGQVFTLPRVN